MITKTEIDKKLKIKFFLVLLITNILTFLVSDLFNSSSTPEVFINKVKDGHKEIKIRAQLLTTFVPNKNVSIFDQDNSFIANAELLEIETTPDSTFASSESYSMTTISVEENWVKHFSPHKIYYLYPQLETIPNQKENYEVNY